MVPRSRSRSTRFPRPAPPRPHAHPTPPPRPRPRLPSPEAWATALTPALARFAITTPTRLAAFLAQITHESAEFCALVERLDYTATRLTAIWPRRFPTPAAAARCAHQPERLANTVYANRLGNGPATSGDGWRYRGRGLIQLTGRANYLAAGAALALDLVTQPEQLETPGPAALAAAWFWHSRRLNELADHHPNSPADLDFVRITQIVSGGKTGLASRRRPRQTTWIHKIGQFQNETSHIAT